MRRVLLAMMMTSLLACAHSHEQAAGEEPVAEAPAPAPADQAAPPAPALTPDQQRAREELRQAQQRLDAARRELAVANSERVAASAEQQHAQAETGSASQAIDSLAQAKAAESARAAEQHRVLAGAHVQYATQLAAARQAEVSAAQARLRTADTAAWIAAHPQDTADGRALDEQRLTQARNAEAQARSRAERLGELALASQRRWEDASRPVSPAPGAGPGRGAPQPGVSTGAGEPAPGQPQNAPAQPSPPPPPGG